MVKEQAANESHHLQTNFLDYLFSIAYYLVIAGLNTKTHWHCSCIDTSNDILGWSSWCESCLSLDMILHRYSTLRWQNCKLCLFSLLGWSPWKKFIKPLTTNNFLRSQKSTSHWKNNCNNLERNIFTHLTPIKQSGKVESLWKSDKLKCIHQRWSRVFELFFYCDICLLHPPSTHNHLPRCLRLLLSLGTRGFRGLMSYTLKKPGLDIFFNI